MKIEQEILTIYKNEYQLIENPILNDYTLGCNIKEVKYPYTKKDTFEYITSVTATLILCQLVYVLIGMLIESSKGEFKNYSIQDYREMINETSLKFISNNLRYKKPLSIKSKPEAKCTLNTIKNLKTYKVYEFSFEIGNKAIIGNLKALKI